VDGDARRCEPSSPHVAATYGSPYDAFGERWVAGVRRPSWLGGLLVWLSWRGTALHARCPPLAAAVPGIPARVRILTPAVAFSLLLLPAAPASATRVRAHCSLFCRTCRQRTLLHAFSLPVAVCFPAHFLLIASFPGLRTQTCLRTGRFRLHCLPAPLAGFFVGSGGMLLAGAYAWRLAFLICGRRGFRFTVGALGQLTRATARATARRRRAPTRPLPPSSTLRGDASAACTARAAATRGSGLLLCREGGSPRTSSLHLR